ncbi:MAG TPA: HAD family acid phosphatase [Candidatus Limnocylindria bacterium]|nr:HAD family acid phosphatase [Candidatus Limnocylindria bacterium]
MNVPIRLARRSRTAVIGLAMALVFATAGVAVGAGLDALHVITPKSADQVTNIDILRMELKNYYGAPGARTGPTGDWTAPLNLASNYADEAEQVATVASKWLHAQADHSGKQAIVLDVDDTTLTTWNYELYSNWDFNPATNGQFVTDQLFPATPGMVDLVNQAAADGYAVFFLTGRPQAQEAATLGNLTDDNVGVDAGYPDPTDATTGVDGLFTKPAVGSYPAYLDKPEFCAAAIAANASCATIAYKSGTRAYIESQGFTIMGNFGDQFSDLEGGFAVKTFKMPNPNYFLP